MYVSYYGRGGEGEADLVFFRREGGEGGDEGRVVGEDVEGLSGGVADFVCRDFSRVDSVCKCHRLGVEIDGKHYRTRRGASSVFSPIVMIRVGSIGRGSQRNRYRSGDGKYANRLCEECQRHCQKD